ncbi:MAG: hypothetical protein WCA27_12360 [Candidatus Sulfotelmatobacter sp.]
MQTLSLKDPARQDYTTDAVYGISRDVPLNYTTRPNVDEKFINNLTREKHIVVYGSSKQGKTCLRKHCLSESDYIHVQCSNKWTLEEIHANVLKRAGFKVEQSEKKTTSGKNKIVASIGATIFGIGSTVGGEKEASTTEEKTTTALELDPSDVNDVIAALESIKFNKYIVLEDFHYLPLETQKDFAVALKAFHEASKLCFIVIGVWLEENRLLVYNGDLTGRVVAINADTWTEPELRTVISKGAELLNVQFTDDFMHQLIHECFNNVYIVQETCRQVCLENRITHTSAELMSLGGGSDVRAAVKSVVAQQTGRYMSFVTQFSAGFQTTSLEMYKWLIYPVLTATAEQLEHGFSYRELRESIQSKHPSGETLNPGNLTQALQSVASLQVKKDITPIILDYDQTNLRLNIVDRGFIIWLNHQNRPDLLAAAGLPTGDNNNPGFKFS